MTNRREGREGREREGERDRERGSRAKPGIQLVPYIALIYSSLIIRPYYFPVQNLHVTSCPKSVTFYRTAGVATSNSSF